MYRKLIFVSALACLYMLLSVVPSGAQGVQKKPLVFYLKNLPCERIGEYSDEKIVADMKADGLAVIEVDCSGFPATSPELEDALVQFHLESESKFASTGEEIDIKSIFYVPEGYTLTRNIPVWNIKEHGAEGSLERVMKTWNDVIVPKHGVEPVTNPEDMYNPDGSPIDWDLCIDIVHPSGRAANDVPLVLNFSSNSPRMAPFSPDKSLEVVYRSIFHFGFMTTGYAWANADHCYNPLARGESWGYFDQYTLEDWNGLAAVRAYVRYLRTHLQDYNLNGRIGVMGISKASYSAVRIADRNNADGEEHFLFNGVANTKPQPWPEGETFVDVAYAAAGNGTRRIPQYVNGNTVPMITSAGSKDEYNQWAVYPEVVKYMEDIDHIHLPLWMEELGHTYPGMGTDLATGENRYVLFKKFFDHYLKPDEATEADVLYVLPKEDSPEVDAKGYSRVLAADGMLPAAMLGLNPYSPVTVRFLEKYDVSEIQDKVKIVNVETSEEIAGSWSAKMQGTAFVFTPDELFAEGQTYRITVPEDITSEAGSRPSKTVMREFTVNKGAQVSENTKTDRIYPTDDTYTAVAKNTDPRGDEATMRVRYSTQGDWRFDGYLKFDITGIDPARIVSASLNLCPSAALTQAPIQVNFFKTYAEWNEEEMVSSNKPALDPDYFDVQTVSMDGNWLEADVSTVLKAALEAGETSLSICVRVPNSETTENIYFNSKEADNESVRPFLSVAKELHSGNPTIDIERIYAVGDEIRLKVGVEYEDEVTGVEWFVNDEPVTGEVLVAEPGMHKVKAIVSSTAGRGKDIIVKYVEVK